MLRVKRLSRPLRVDVVSKSREDGSKDLRFRSTHHRGRVSLPACVHGAYSRLPRPTPVLLPSGDRGGAHRAGSVLECRSARAKPMSEPTHEDLHDLTVAVEGVSYELEAVNQTLRELLGVLAVGADLDPVPSWVNRGEESSERLAEPGETHPGQAEGHRMIRGTVTPWASLPTRS